MLEFLSVYSLTGVGIRVLPPPVIIATFDITWDKRGAKEIP
jgi:hypothetical protein